MKHAPNLDTRDVHTHAQCTATSEAYQVGFLRCILNMVHVHDLACYIGVVTVFTSPDTPVDVFSL